MTGRRTWFEQLLKQYYGPLQLQVRAAVSAHQWDGIIDTHKQGSWWHRYDWLDYCLAYKNGVDYSFAASANGAIVAIYPLICERDTFALGGNPLVPALLEPSAPDEITSAAMIVGRNLVNIVARQCGIAHADMMLPPVAAGPVTTDAAFHSDEVTESTAFVTRMVDLEVPERDRWRAIRKSYHQLIRRGQEKYRICGPAFDGFTAQMMQYRVLHQSLCPGARPLETYQLQQGFCRSGHAYPYLAYTRDGRTVGAAVWYVYKRLAYYASGVYAENNVAHAVLWHAMNDLAARGVRYAELGWQGRALDDKGQAVEFFKRGFGGEDWPIPCMRRTFLTHQEAAS